MKDFKQHTPLQNLKQGESLDLLRTDFGEPAPVVTFPDLLVAKRKRNIGFTGDEALPFEITHQVDAVDFYGYKSSYEALGLYLFQLLFSGKNYIHLKLTREQSKITNVFLYIDRTLAKDSFLKTEALAIRSYGYYREQLEKFPLSGPGFSDRTLAPEDCPVFLFGWSDAQKRYLEDHVQYADQLIIGLTVDGLCALATILLDMAAEENDRDEVCLEHPDLGFGGTGKNSLEARFWLPHSFGFYGDSLDDLKI